MKRSTALCAIIILITLGKIQASTIIPYQNLGEMMLGTETVVLARVSQNYELTLDNQITRFRSSLEVIESIKGRLLPGEEFDVQNFHLRTGDLERVVPGDLNLREGHTYLLFLQEHEPNVWQATMLSYGALEQHERQGELVLVPFDMGREIHLHIANSHNPPERLGVYYQGALIRHFRDILRGTRVWNRDLVLSPDHPGDFELGFRSDPPGFCTYISGTPFARWQDIEVTDVPVRYFQGGDSECANAAAIVDNAIGVINSNYLGVNLSNAGTHNFVPSCIGQGAVDNEFTTWVENNLGGLRNTLVQFEDPCDEIAGLDGGCIGTLAIGGLYWSSAEYEYEGETYRIAAYGFVLINDGAGNCFCGSEDYEILMTHELTHTLNMNHIAESEGDANMNPTCCDNVSNLDIQCLDFLYPLPALPVELTSFTGQAKQETIDLEWVVGAELDNDYYLLERQSSSGRFQEIYRTSGVGNTTTERKYEFVDRNPLAGDNLYRLSQFDLDGTQSELGLINIRFEKEEPLLAEVFPNPLEAEELNIRIYSEAAKELTFSIYSLNGQLLDHQQAWVASGYGSNQIDVSKLSSGVYMLQIAHQDGLQTMRFMKR
ncbi:MAG: T9SS type A sorting domain-containing protein [Bacteroidota bacterium]